MLLAVCLANCSVVLRVYHLAEMMDGYSVVHWGNYWVAKRDAQWADCLVLSTAHWRAERWVVTRAI